MPSEFSKYLFNIVDTIEVEISNDIKEGDVILLTEIRYIDRKNSGCHLVYKVRRVKTAVRLCDDFIIDRLYIERQDDLNFAQLIKKVKD
ncbi:MAG TPA: hypothetical protein PKA69_15355 [Lacibacter sp.]|nr:hypothetical protein [Lacibacter sp.]